MKRKISNSKVVLIRRVSSKGQKDNASPEAQNREAVRYATVKDLQIVDNVNEVASGTTDSLEKREAYQYALDLCVKNNWNLLVSNADRLCRNVGQAVREVLDKGIEIWEADSELDRPLTKEEVVRRITEAETEAKKIKRRTHKGVLRRIHAGKYHGGTKEYRSDEARIKAAETKRKRIVNSDENKRAVSVAINLRLGGLTYEKIADYLNENNYKPRAFVMETAKFREAYRIDFSTKEMRAKLHADTISFTDWEVHQQNLKNCMDREKARKKMEGTFTGYSIRSLVLYFHKNSPTEVNNRLVITDKLDIYISGRIMETREAKSILLDTSISLHKAAKQLNDLGIKAERGGEFYPNTIKQIRAKLIPPQA